MAPKISEFSKRLNNGLYYSCMQFLAISITSAIGVLWVDGSSGCEILARTSFACATIMGVFIILFKVRAIEIGLCPTYESLLLEYNNLANLTASMYLLGFFFYGISGIDPDNVSLGYVKAIPCTLIFLYLVKRTTDLQIRANAM